ncbi:hypothetical protein BEP19_00870 [Ammoniphilus oxalaticus]|uniref:YqzE family protein n=1 Tax=Ammoniphilus oxalaticus TaxID=66863 RepID=A0A419SMT0_9BACL|nr:YqzE family protein [Ammoniphilus oxalaticus]RKD25529.1 hypothetical protein BEP19_00870 [Ammoniphilus oxalaticus]
MKTNDIVKYMTEEFVRYIDTPKAERKKKGPREQWSSRYFGMIPMALRLSIANKRAKKKRV